MRVREKGVVRSVKEGSAVVQVLRGEESACASCGLCSRDGESSIVVVDARPSLAAGDGVIIEIDTPSPYAAAWLLFGQPLALLIAGILAGLRLGRAIFAQTPYTELTAVLAAVLLVSANYLAVRWLDRRVFSVRRARARIVEITK